MAKPASTTWTAAVWVIIAAASSAALSGTVRWIRDDVDWRVIAFVRASIGLVAAFVVVRLRGVRIPRRPPRALWIRSVSGGLALLCTFYASARISVADVTVLVNSSPIWLVLLSALAFGHRPRRAVWSTLALGTIGIVLITQPGFAQGNLGGLAAATSGVLGAVSLLAITRMRALPASAIVLYANLGFVVASGLVVIASLGQLDAGFVHSPRLLGLLALIGVLALVLQFALTRGYAVGDSVRVAPLQYMSAAFGVAIDTLAFSDPPSLVMLAGTALVIVPAIWILRHPRQALLVHHVQLSSPPDIERARVHEIEAAIRRAELLTSCELRVHIERECGDRAARPAEVFAALEMTRTKLRNAVLVYVALESRVFAVVVDEGISDLVPRAVIDKACASVARAIDARATSDIIAATTDGIITIMSTLARWFPHQVGDANELDDSISW